MQTFARPVLIDARRQKLQDRAKLLRKLSEDDCILGNESSYEAAHAEHSRFVEFFSRGDCYLCERPLTSFSTKLPCLHWLLKPKGFKKKHFPELAKRYGFFQTQSFLRWIANQDGFARNINDLPEEGSGSKLFEVTIRYKAFEWAFSCAPSD